MSDEEVEAAIAEHCARWGIQNPAAVGMVRRAYYEGVMLEAAAAVRVPVPGESEAERIVRDVAAQAIRFRQAGRGTTPVQERALDFVASHPSVRAAQEGTR